MMIGPQWPNGETEGIIQEYPLESLLEEIETLQERIDQLEPATVRSSTLEELELALRSSKSRNAPDDFGQPGIYPYPR